MVNYVTIKHNSNERKRNNDALSGELGCFGHILLMSNTSAFSTSHELFGTFNQLLEVGSQLFVEREI